MQPNARGEPRQQRERSGCCWRRLQCDVRCGLGQQSTGSFDLSSDLHFGQWLPQGCV